MNKCALVVSRLAVVGAAFALLACGDDSSSTSAGQADASTGGADTGSEPDDDGTMVGTTLEPADSGGSTSDGASSDGAVDTTAAAESDGDTGSDTSIVDADGALFVRPDGVDSAPGTPDEPLRTIQTALQRASDDPGVERIYVATGTYETRFEDSTQLVLVDGVSLFGGFSADWTTNDPLAMPSTIIDVSEVDLGAAFDDPHRPIEVPAGVSEATEFAGFNIVVQRGTIRCGILLEGNATIRGNTFVHGDAGEQGGSESAVLAFGGAAAILDNRIALSVGSDSEALTGIHLIDFDGVVANNTVQLSHGAVGEIVVGIRLTGGAPEIVHNTMLADTAAILLRLGNAEASPSVTNNYLQASAAEGTCLRTASAKPTLSFENNVVNCAVTLDEMDVTQHANIMGLESALTMASGNLNLEGTTLDAADDLALDASVPCTATRGGMFLPAVQTDIAGLERTEPVSIGAHEWDGDCL